MRHRSNVRKFGRKKGQRRAFIQGLASNLVLYEKITTTEARAKELRPYIERLLTHAKKQQPSALRYLLRFLPKARAYKLYHEISPRYQERKGGYTRVVKLATQRKHDGSERAVIEFV